MPTDGKSAHRPESFDAAVVGGGHNGLIAATYLALAGKRCVVLERRENLGGLAGPATLPSGTYVPACSEIAGTLLPQVVSDLKLRGHGLKYVPLDPVALVLSESEPLALFRDTDRSVGSIRARSSADAQQFAPFSDEVETFARVLHPVLGKSAPQPTVENGAELFDLLRLGLSVRQLGARKMREALRVFALSVSDYLDEWFELDELKAAIGASAVSGICHGPRSVGTAAKLLFQHASPVSRPLCYRHGIAGGVTRLSDVLTAAARHAGVELRTGCEVRRIESENGRVQGLVLADGSTIRTKLAVSSVAPATTLLELSDPTQFTPEFIREVQNIRHRGVAAILNLVLDGPPRFPQVKDDSLAGGVIQIGASLDSLEKAYDATKYGQIAENPLLIMMVPTLRDPSRRVNGHHLMNIQMQFAPYALRGSEWATVRPQLLETILKALESHAPNIRNQIVEQHLMTPADFESEFALPEGHWDQGEMTLDQMLFMRPVPGWARYRMPLSGLYLCGAGTHPGGGLFGANGHNAAKQILRDQETYD